MGNISTTLIRPKKNTSINSLTSTLAIILQCILGWKSVGFSRSQSGYFNSSFLSCSIRSVLTTVSCLPTPLPHIILKKLVLQVFDVYTKHNDFSACTRHAAQSQNRRALTTSKSWEFRHSFLFLVILIISFVFYKSDSNFLIQ